MSNSSSSTDDNAASGLTGPSPVPLSGAQLRARPELPTLGIIGMIALIWSASVYSIFGLTSYPRQEWLLELLVGIVFVLPVFGFLKGRGSVSASVRVMGAMLLLHTVWSALHWPGHIVIQTPLDPRIPLICTYFDLPLGFLLLVRGK